MKTKIFLASNPYNPNNNLSGFYSNLMSDEAIDVLHPASFEELKEEDLKGKVADHEIARLDKLNILNSEFVIIDSDTEIRAAYPYWACVNPKARIIFVSKTLSIIPDPFYAEKVVAIVKPELLLPTLYLLLSESQVKDVQDKPSQALD